MGLFDSAKDKLEDMKDGMSKKDDNTRTDTTGMNNDMDMADTDMGGGTGQADDRMSGTRMTDDTDTDIDRDMNLRREYTDRDETA